MACSTRRDHVRGGLVLGLGGVEGEFVLSKNGNKVFRNRIVSHGELPANQFLAHDLNARRHPNTQREAMRGILDEIGFVQGVIVSKRSGKLLDGHLRIEEALTHDETQPIPFVEVDVTEAEERVILAGFDPLTAMASYDKEVLDLLLKEVSTGDAAVQKMLSDLAKENGLQLETKDAPEAQIDKAAELQKKWKVKSGDLWKIGRHRLLCGDSTNKSVVEWLMGGEHPDMVFTDPPYGMDLDTDYSKLKGTAKSPNAKGYKYDKVKGDDRPFDFSPFAEIPCAEQFWWGADYYAKQLPDGGSWNVWQKRNEADSEMIGNDFEMCWSKTRHKRQIVRIRWVGWDATEKGETRAHPTQKPVALAAWYINQHSKPDDIVVDYFAGSGFTSVAAEQTGRKCYAMEISPEYCSVTLERLETMGLEPKRVNKVKAA